MAEDIATEVLSTTPTDDGVMVRVKTTKFSPIPSQLMVRERAKARAIAEAGLVDTVSGVFTGPYDISRLTSVEDFELTDSSYPENYEYSIEVDQ